MQQGCTFPHVSIRARLLFPVGDQTARIYARRYGKAKRSPLVVKNVPPAYTLTWTTK
jgi:hypothetical protein